MTWNHCGATREVERIAVVGVLAMVVLSGCDARSPRTVVVATDSAGVRIVENRFATEDLDLFVEVGALELSIGVVEGDPEYTFGSITAVRAMPDGGVVVADRQAAVLRTYGADGIHRLTMGGQGRGPGEFAAVDIAGVGPDGIYAWDERNRRVTHFGLDGALVEVVTFGFRGVRQLTRLDSGGFVGSAPRSAAPAQSHSGLRVQVDSLVVLHIGPDGVVVDTIAVVPGVEIVLDTFEGADGTVRTLRSFRPFGADPYVVADPRGRVTTAWTRTWSLVVRDLSGTTTSIVRAPELQPALDRARVDDLRAQLTEASYNQELLRFTERMFDEVPTPELEPAFSDLKIDALGNHWVRAYSTTPEEVTEWLVFAETGEILGRASLPAGFRVHQIGEDYLLGVERDELDVQYVRKYTLRRGS